MIDFNFISRLEGGRATRGYVPDPEGSKSGVTIGTGVDLGQMAEGELERLNLPPALKDKLRPYVGKKRYSAVRLLEEMPLHVSEEEAELIDVEVKSRFVHQLTERYQEATGRNFEELPDGVQTVIASVAFQYGDLSRRTPNFWRQVTTGDWHGAYENLRDFGDNYSTRRNKEADLFKQSLEESGLAVL